LKPATQEKIFLNTGINAINLNFYCKKLNLLFKESLQLASAFPDLGIPTQFKDIKLTIVSHFEIIYKVIQSEIVVLDIWDSRQNSQHFTLR